MKLQFRRKQQVVHFGESYRLSHRIGILFILLGIALLSAGCGVGQRLPEWQAGEAAATVHLVRAFQRVQRYDCEGVIYSDKVEEVQTAHAKLSAPAAANYNLNESLRIYNRSTGSEAPMIEGGESFWVDISAKAALAMHVSEGVNELEYELIRCETTCEVIQSGEMRIGVSFEETHFEDTWVVEAVPESCSED